jgi:hypothetical protein
MDRLNFQSSKYSPKRYSPWFHLDQTESDEKQCVQGYLDLGGSLHRQVATLQVIAQSHDHSMAIVKRAKEEGRVKRKNWYSLDQQEVQALLDQGDIVQE